MATATPVKAANRIPLSSERRMADLHCRGSLENTLRVEKAYHAGPEFRANIGQRLPDYNIALSDPGHARRAGCRRKSR